MYGIQTPSAKTPILNADFNKEESWDTILEALTLTGERFNGVFDKIYFDVSTAKAAKWNEVILAKIATLLKKSGELYIPDAKLAGQSFFCDSEVETDSDRKGPTNYQLQLEDQKDPNQQEKINRPYSYSLSPANRSTHPFLMGGGTTGYGIREGKMYLTNSLGLIYDTTFQSSETLGHPLKFEVFEGNKMYPNIGMEYRQESSQIIEQHLRINSFIKVTLEGAKKGEAEEISLKVPTIDDTVIETTATCIPEGYKEIKFPSLALIKEKLNFGNSLVSSETDCFHVQSIMGIFIGFTSPVLDLKMKCVGISSDYKDKGFYTISGILDVMFDGDKKTRIILNSSSRKEREYISRGNEDRKREFLHGFRSRRFENYGAY